jgi:hypothetical protein
MSAMHAVVELKLTQLHEQLTAIIAARVHPKHGAYMCKKYKYGRCCRSSPQGNPYFHAPRSFFSWKT